MDNSVTIEGTASPVGDLNLQGVLRIPAVRQVLLLVGVAAAVAAGFAIVLWSQAPSYARLFSNLPASEAAAVAEALAGAGIEHRVNVDAGSIEVPASRVHDARLELASQELPNSGSGGMAMLSEQSGFGVSQFMESARYQHALEGELARTIAHLGAVENARVHLALPKQTSFIRDRREASASVLLTLHRGRALEPEQAAAIVHLVASSVANLKAGDVTLIDQHGRLLSETGSNTDARLAADSFERARQLEAVYRRRIEDLLTPLLGPGRVRAQVVADLDFTIREQTRESFDPERSVVRSEQVNIQRQDTPTPDAAGIPGALSNQPPVTAAAQPAAPDDVNSVESVEVSQQSTRNYELDRTISHTRPESGTIERLSVAVLVDDSAPEGTAAEDHEPLSPADIERFTALVKEAVGFNAARGDSVVVVNAAFRAPPEFAERAEMPLWEQPLLRDLLKQILGAALVLALGFGLVRPLLRGIVDGNVSPKLIASGAGGDTARLPRVQAAPAGPTFDQKIAAARKITGHDPARVAQVVRKWVSVDDN